jgi:hypothetical protein
MRIMSVGVLFAFILASASPAVAEDSPADLVRDLARAARDGDEASFLAELSSGTRRAMADAGTAQSKLGEALAQYSTALNEKFGSGRLGGAQRFPGSDRGTALSRFIDITLTSVDQKAPRQAVLHIRTVTKGPGGQTAVQEDIFPAVEENAEWKLDLTALMRGITLADTQRAAAYRHVAQQIRSGVFKSRVSAQTALLKARRGNTGDVR